MGKSFETILKALTYHGDHSEIVVSYHDWENQIREDITIRDIFNLIIQQRKEITQYQTIINHMLDRMEERLSE